jgi:hypothetical protein
VSRQNVNKNKTANRFYKGDKRIAIVEGLVTFIHKISSKRFVIRQTADKSAKQADSKQLAD